MNYFLTDHLGSVRVIVDGGGVVKERSDYYPFGAMPVRGDYPQLATNRLRYNGKEEQITGDLKYLDYGWRMYDSSLGRWFGMDPLAEKYLPFTGYHYCLNSPLLFKDADGRAVWRSNNGDRISITGDDIYQYWITLENVLDGKTPLDNFYKALDEAADSPESRFKNLAGEVAITPWSQYDGENYREFNVATAIFTFENFYNTFMYNHYTYTTTRGKIKPIYKSNGEVRSRQAAKFATRSKIVKGVGTLGTIVSTRPAIQNIYDDRATILDYSDAVVGTTSLINSVAPRVGGYSIPGWGQCSALYDWTRLWFDLGVQYGPSKWF